VRAQLAASLCLRLFLVSISSFLFLFVSPSESLLRLTLVHGLWYGLVLRRLGGLSAQADTRNRVNGCNSLLPSLFFFNHNTPFSVLVSLFRHLSLSSSSPSLSASSGSSTCDFLILVFFLLSLPGLNRNVSEQFFFFLSLLRDF
jgi:hypothetical protein